MGKYDNLKNKTIFDFCDDVEVLRFITKQESPSRTEYIKRTDARSRLMGLVLLAEITGNDDLNEAASPLLKWTYDWSEETCDFIRIYKRNHGKFKDD